MTKFIKNIPAIRKVLAFVFLLGVSWSTLNARITALETKIVSLDTMRIEATLSQIQTDLEWIKTTMKNK